MVVSPRESSTEGSANTTISCVSDSAKVTGDHPCQTVSPEKGEITLDIEHVFVEDDPRKWGRIRKNTTLWLISGAAMISGLAANIQNPANAEIQRDLHASSGQISWTLATFIIIQGNFPLIWSAVSEIQGRKPVYLVATLLLIVGSALVATSRSIQLAIGMRALQAAGSSAFMSISAATLADMYDSHERGSKMGIFYAAPLLGPALGPLIGGVLAQSFNWRANFYFLVICGAVILMAFLSLFKDTFRRERSLTYQGALMRRVKELELDRQKNGSDTTIAGVGIEVPAQKTEESHANLPDMTDIEADEKPHLDIPAIAKTNLSFKDVNPFPPLYQILRRKNNLAILQSSALIFGFSYSISYTCARTLTNSYNYDALKTGLVLLSFGIGSMAGSIFGGRWSDRELARLKEANNGIWIPEMRLSSTKMAMLWLPPSVIGYAWVCEKHVHVAAICVMLFLSGFFSVWMYTSALAYIVDANTGRSCSAVATNSSFRGTLAFVAAEVAIPLQNTIGDGGLYTLWAGLLVIMELLILLVLHKGEKWRRDSEEKEKQNNI
ncbi:major facilitator superfamily domain-containing protein [Hygrophoropsis aurantiaca]|uniref:Major facilitator superfamily domain-containing protein n=1 Tax=Hygrophoropsis aurantiaca TaxID=72124 RepID=A0ACB8AST8_9AGAM|nr:major facilitator superfamily domain-containing protein [Hygrophoropsis aurantiaca]